MVSLNDLLDTKCYYVKQDVTQELPGRIGKIFQK